jgi:hypothetical protein
MVVIRCSLLFASLLLASRCPAQDVDSGPDTGKPVPALMVFDGTGPNQDKELDYAAERKEKPTIYVFIQSDKWARPMARFLRKLDEVVVKQCDDAYVIAVWLTDNAEKTKEYLPVAQRSLKFQNTALTCYPGEKAGPKDWGIYADAHLSAIVATKGCVTKRFGYRSINETDVPAVQEALKKALTDK